MNQVKTDAKKRGFTGKKIAKWIDVSEGMVTKYYKAESDMPAIKFIDLVKFIYDDKEHIAKDCILEFITKTTRTDNHQELLEWAANSGDIDYIEKIKERIANSSLVKDSMIYQMIRDRNVKKITSEEFYLKIEDFKISENLMFDTKILLKIATLYAQLDLKSYSVMILLANNILENLDAVSSEYLQQSFKMRTLEMIAYAHLKRGEVDEVERIAEELLVPEIIDRFPMPANAILILLAEANLFRNPLKSLTLIQEAIQMYKEKKLSYHLMRKSVLEATHDFIKIYNGDYKGLYLTDLSERAHLFAKQGYRKEALVLLKELERKNHGLSGHQYYYKGLATKRSEDFQQALNKFAIQGDSFYMNLINNHLKYA
jgi:hypothetical protein